jgi:chromosome segregation protein
LSRLRPPPQKRLRAPRPRLRRCHCRNARGGSGQGAQACCACGEAVAEARAASASRARETAGRPERNAAAGREAIEWRGRAARAPGTACRGRRAPGCPCRGARRAGGPAGQQAISIEALERDAAASEGAVATSAGAERDAEQAVSIAAQALATTGEAFAAAREARAGAAARAEAQASRRQEYARISGERFECPPPLLPERIGFDAATLNDPDEEKNALDRWTNERERIGPVNLIADQELAELDGARLAAVAERDELGQAISRLRGSIGSLNREGRLRLLAPSSRSTATSAACSRLCSRAGRRISSWSKATIRSRPGWRSWPSRRASG